MDSEGKSARMKMITTKDKGAPHGMPSTLKDQVNADLLAFCERGSLRAAP